MSWSGETSGFVAAIHVVVAANATEAHRVAPTASAWRHSAAAAQHLKGIFEVAIDSVESLFNLIFAVSHVKQHAVLLALLPHHICGLLRARGLHAAVGPASIQSRRIILVAPTRA